MLAWILAGAALGAAFLRIARAGGADRERRVLSAGLVVAALVYVGFALAAGDGERVVVAAVGASLFSLPAYAGVRGWPLLLAIGWGAHGLWDGLLHLTGPEYGPQWYAALCLGFDPVVAVVLAGRARVGTRIVPARMARSR